MSPEDAARRRDFTINAIAEDPLTGELLDPTGGRADLERKLLRVVDPARFGEDPLRVLRGAVFAAQFSLTVDPKTAAVMRRTAPALRELAHERIGEEWRKLLLRPQKPSLGLRLLMDWGALAVLHPDFVQLAETPQNPEWHPEGDVWTHTLMVVDEAAMLTADGALSAEDRWHVLLAALCHDLGKGAKTKRVGGVWRSIGHAGASAELTRRFLGQIAADRWTIGVVTRLAGEHMAPFRFFKRTARGEAVPDGEIRKLARRLTPATVHLLTLVADADHRGRGPFYGEHGRTVPSPLVDAGRELRKSADALGVLYGPPTPILRGEDLIALGLKPGPAFGEILRRADALHDARGATRRDLLERLGGSASVEEALQRLVSGYEEALNSR